MNEKSVHYWLTREREGDIRVLEVLKVLDLNWCRTADVADKAGMVNNLALEILHFLVATNRVTYKLSGSGARRGYAWRLANNESLAAIDLSEGLSV